MPPGRKERIQRGGAGTQRPKIGTEKFGSGGGWNVPTWRDKRPEEKNRNTREKEDARWIS